jgi:hypothetical protein
VQVNGRVRFPVKEIQEVKGSKSKSVTKKRGGQMGKIKDGTMP